MGKLVHGEARRQKRSNEWGVWVGMIQRCYDPKSHAYEYYGARGISICERWRNSYENFLADMGRRPTPNHTIDRINNDGDYEPSNCRWITRQEQNKNRRPRRNAIGIAGAQRYGNKFKAQFRVNGRTIHLGVFETALEAAAAYTAAKSQMEI